MKVSEITTEYIADYLRIDEPEEIQLREIEATKAAAIAYASSYTGLTVEELDEHEDIAIAVMVQIADMYENRNLYLDYKSKEVNKTVTNILGLYQKNLV